MDGQAQRRLAPDGIGIGGADLEQMVAGVQIREGDAVLRADVDPAIRQSRHPVREAVALRRRKIERTEVERDDACSIIERDAIHEPERGGRAHGNAKNLYPGEGQARWLSTLGQARRIEDVEAAGAAESEAPVAQTKVRAIIELLSLQPVLAVIGLDGSGVRLVAHETGVAAEPEVSA